MKPKIYAIDAESAHPADELLPEVGNKAFNLMRLASLNLPVPPAFVLSTGYCRQWGEHGHRLSKELPDLMASHVRRLENVSGLSFGDPRRPLLLSVRSGAAASMPGMMETLLNIGLTMGTLPGFIALTGKPRLAWDSMRRLVQSFAEIAKGAEAAGFDAVTAAALDAAGVTSTAELDTLSLRVLTMDLMAHYASVLGEPFPEDPMEQLTLAVEAVFRSWDSDRAITYRRLNQLTGLPGTAVTVQRMVFGNGGAGSGSGVGFTRNPATGANELFMEFLFNAQGEDVVSGRFPVESADSLAALLPEAYQQLVAIRDRLEHAFGDVQDFEFTIENGRVYLLQTRRAKRTDWAALQIAVDLAREGMIEPKEALARVKDLPLQNLVRYRLQDTGRPPLAKAKSAGIGVASGRLAMTSADAVAMAERGEPAILVRLDTTTDDIAGMNAAAGILTRHGGRTSHAAVIARQLNKVCLVGCSELKVSEDQRQCSFGGIVLKAGEFVTLDGDTGYVLAGKAEIVAERPDANLAQVEAWRELQRANDNRVKETQDREDRTREIAAQTSAA